MLAPLLALLAGVLIGRVTARLRLPFGAQADDTRLDVLRRVLGALREERE